MRKPLLVAAVGVLAWPTPAAAQATPAPASASDDVEVEVWGTRPGNPTRSGASVSVVTRKTLESLPGGETQPLTYVLASQPGFVTDTLASDFTPGPPTAECSTSSMESRSSPLPWASSVPRGVLADPSYRGHADHHGRVSRGVWVRARRRRRHRTRRAVGGPAGEVQLSTGTYGLWDAAINYSQQLGNVGLFVAGNLQTTNRGLTRPR